MRTMQEVYSQSLARTSFTLVMLGIAGAMALVLGIIGIYGVISYAVSQRTREIGIRLALGAEEKPAKVDVRSLRVGADRNRHGHRSDRGRRIDAAHEIAIVRGQSDGPLTYVSVLIILTASAVLASYLPARRAAAVDPVEALRAE